MRVSIAPWWARSRFTYDKHANCGHFELLLASLRTCPLFTESKHSRRIQQAYRQDGRHIRDDKIQMQAMIRSHSMRSLLTSASNQCLCPVADGNTRCLPQRRSLADTMSHHAGNCPEHSDTFYSGPEKFKDRLVASCYTAISDLDLEPFTQFNTSPPIVADTTPLLEPCPAIRS